jgi:integrase
MSSVYSRGQKLWISYHDAAGKRQRQPTGLNIGQEVEATKVLKKIDERISAQKDSGTISGDATFTEYFDLWIQKRKGLRRAALDDETRIRKHVLPRLGHLPLADIRPRHIKDLAMQLISTDLAPRTVRHIYSVTHTMMEDAVLDELIDNNPCVLKKGKGLPKIVDKDPTWRSQAVFTRDEVITLTTNSLIPEQRRILYSLLFLTGCRIGEVAALRWNRYDRSTKPLGKLLIASSWDTKKQREQPLKTEVPREVPVHAVLAQVLSDWWDSGFARIHGRAPTSEDLICPYRAVRGQDRSPIPLRSDRVRKDLDADCKALGLRHRRTHDARRTLVSVAREDGARMDILQWVTHGRPGGIINMYSEVPWKLLCEQIGCIKIASLAPSQDGASSLLTPPGTQKEKAVTAGAHPAATALNHSAILVEAAGIELGDRTTPDVHPRALSVPSRAISGTYANHPFQQEAVWVALAPTRSDIVTIVTTLSSALTALDQGHEERARQILVSLLAQLEAT